MNYPSEAPRTIKASDLPRERQEELRQAIRDRVVDELARSIKDVDIDLSKTEIVLRPGVNENDWTLNDLVATTGVCGHLAAFGRFQWGPEPDGARTEAQGLSVFLEERWR